MKHTKGPWNWHGLRLMKTNENEHGHILGSEEIAVFMPMPRGSKAIEEATANIKLCAAAPDMLEALQNCVNVISLALQNRAWDSVSNDNQDSEDDVMSVLSSARDALNKATGK